MTTAQKIIKYLAIAFAIFLIVTIISTTLGVLFGLSAILGLKKDIEENLNTEMTSTSFENSYITNLDIEIAFTNLTIKTGETFKVETDNNNIKFEQENQKLEIKEKNKKWFSNYEEKDLILYLPKDLELEKVHIELGAGETEIQDLIVSKECEIEGGAGKLSVSGGTINGLDLDLGVGEVNLQTVLTGKNEINAGVGNLNIDLQGDATSYKIQADKGIGNIKINGDEIFRGETIGNGENYIEVNGGIGNIDINFNNTL